MLICSFSFAISHPLLIQFPLYFYPISLLSLTPPFYTLPHAHHPFSSLTPHLSYPPLPLQPTNNPQDCTAKAITHRIQKIKSAATPTTDPDAATPASSPTKAAASTAAKKPRASPTKKVATNGKGKAAAAKGKANKRKHVEMEDGSDVTEGEGKGDKKMKVKEEDQDEEEDEDENAGVGEV